MTIQDVYSELDRQCIDSLNVISLVNTSEYLSSDDKKKIQDLVVKQAFLSVFTEWEHFLEDATIAYSLDEPSIEGDKPNRYIWPVDRDHADSLIKGVASYPDWSDMDTVKRLESSLFENGAPFLGALNGFSSKYKEMKKVRNVIVHNSIKSRDEFDTLVRNVLNVSSVGITPTEFLLSKKGSNPAFYRSYITHIQNASKQIAFYKK